jgi:hypothetical protein
VICDFRGVTIEEEGEGRVRVAGRRGLPPTDSYKVSATAMQGFRAAGTLVIVGIDAAAKARRTAEAILERTRALLREAGFADFSAHPHRGARRRSLLRSRTSRAAAARGGDDAAGRRPRERGALEIFAREIGARGHLWSPGTTGRAAAGRASRR